MSEIGNPRLLSRRVDWLTIAFQLQIAEADFSELDRRVQCAKAEGGGSKIEWSRRGVSFAIKACRSPGHLQWENADAHGKFDTGARGGWWLEVILRPTFLATHGLEESISAARAIARAFGCIVGERVRRVDLCADFLDWEICESDAEALLTRQRAKVTGYVDLEDGKRQSHLRGRKLTGHTVCPGGELMCRIYDKAEELLLSGREEKRLIEEAIWRPQGWQVGDRVVRVEFQLRGGVLDEFELRDPNALSARVDPVWRYCTSDWLRLIILGSATRPCNCASDPRWEVAQRVTFVHTCADAAVRRRKRGGPSVHQALGTNRSYLASLGRLRRLPLGAASDGRPAHEETTVGRLTTGEASDLVEASVREVAQAAAAAMVDELVDELGPHGAAVRVIRGHNATVARFASEDTAAEESS